MIQPKYLGEQMRPFELMTERIKTMWSAEIDYQPLANQGMLTSELLVQAASVQWGERVLDVAAGTGNTALAAARRGARVTATDLSPVGLERAERRAAAEGVQLETEVADAQRLPYEDGSFDVVLSTYGVMYAPDQQKAADELLRVCRPGGRVGLVSHCPSGFMKDLQRVLPTPPFEVPSPHLWGTEARYGELFGERLEILSSEVLEQETFGESAQAQVEVMLEHLPPWRMMYAGLDDQQQATFTKAVEEIYQQHNEIQASLRQRSEYLQVVGRAC
jgi:SAM-dependent methyltransferase